MDAASSSTLLSIVRPWPIAINLAIHLPAGDLINLARTNSSLRAALHGFDPPFQLSTQEATLEFSPKQGVRSSLHIGHHRTSYWEELKHAAPFLCASSTHTKGSTPRPCRYCSSPICEACIVRDFFAKPSENTFKNRSRFLCKGCWTSGTPHKRMRFISEIELGTSERYTFAPGTGDFCACTNKGNGWICIPCKKIQNAEAKSSGFRQCFGEGCSELLEDDKDRRRICLWCDKPMLPGRASVESRLAFDQKMMDVRARRPASDEESTRKRQKLLRISRRELRGEFAVGKDSESDTPEFIRHLDTVNYERFMKRKVTPSGERIYQSKMGRWTYDREFLLNFRMWCHKIPIPSHLGAITAGDDEFRGMTNQEKWEEARKVQRPGSPRLRPKDLGCRPEEPHSGSSTFTGPQTLLDSAVLATNTRGESDKQHFLEESFVHVLPNSAHVVNTSRERHNQSTKGPQNSPNRFSRTIDSSLDPDEDFAMALALQSELDREAAEEVEAEWIAELAEQSQTDDENDSASYDPSRTSIAQEHAALEDWEQLSLEPQSPFFDHGRKQDDEQEDDCYLTTFASASP